ncbi:MAG TPA: ribonuclease P protein component [Alphaproteobacteria bacterium]|nr:ribonuclease P protein component [Alphaproteobacteria bacterium]
MPVGLGRLRSRSDFLRVAAASHKCVRPGLILQAAPQPPHDHAAHKEPHDDPRVGFTVTRKVGNAVERNRARRRLRAAAREVLARDALPGHDYVIIGRRETLRRAYPDLLADLAGALRKLGAARSGHGR